MWNSAGPDLQNEHTPPDRVGRRTRVAVAMSGGVDSAVAAYLLAKQGYDVLGVTLKLFCYGEADDAATERSCCSLDAIEDARRSARAIGARHVVLDFADEFRATVLDPFVGDYLGGRTPSPCVACNSEVKFNRFLVRALRQGADFIATGHYARIVAGAGGRPELHAGIDAAKDQSYFLWGVEREALSRVLLPIGDYTKAEVRAIARRAGLPVAEKKESMDICFVPQGDYGAFLEKERRAASVVENDESPMGKARGVSNGSSASLRERVPDENWEAALAPGPIVNDAGDVVGTHAGFARVTIGQRKGLGLASGRRLYVTGIDPASRRVVVGEDADLFAAGCEAEGASFLVDVRDDAPMRVAARIRHRHTPVPSMLERLDGGRARVLFDEPQRAVTPGQSVVFYDGARVVGGAIISGAIARPA